MSMIPTDIAAAALQTSQVQLQAAGIQKAETDAKDNAFRQQIRVAELKDGTVSANDDDTRIDGDGGGTGGQGRAFRGPKEEAPTEDDADQAGQGITVDESGRVHLDLEA
jgi:hypothetical protein